MPFDRCDLTRITLAWRIEKEPANGPPGSSSPCDSYIASLELCSLRSIFRMLRGEWVGWEKHDRDGIAQVLHFLKTLRWYLVAALVATSCREQLAHPAVQFARPGPSVHLVVPEQGAYTGAYIDFGETEDNVILGQVKAFEQAVGKHQDIVASSSYWGKRFPFTISKLSPATTPFPSSTGRLGTNLTRRSEDPIAFPSTRSLLESGMPTSTLGLRRQNSSGARSCLLGA